MAKRIPQSASSPKFEQDLSTAVSLCRLMDDWPERVYIKNARREFIYANKATLGAVGFKSVTELLGMKDEDLFSYPHADEARDEEETLLGLSLAAVDSQKLELETWQDGSLRFVSTTRKVLLDSEGRRVGIMGITRDLTVAEREDFLRRLAELQAEDSDSISTNLKSDTADAGFWWSERLGDTQPTFDDAFSKTFPGKRPNTRMRRVADDDRTQVLNFLRSAKNGEVGHQGVIDYRYLKENTADMVRGIPHVVSPSIVQSPGSARLA